MRAPQKSRKRPWFKGTAGAIAVLLTLFLLLPLAGNYARYRSKETIRTLVINNLAFLDEAADGKHFDDPLALTRVERRSIRQNDQGGVLVEYFCRGYGIVPSSVYSGFYYTSTDGPVGHEGRDDPLTATDNGWKWQEPDGDNWYYTEKIADHWYYYEAGF